ncbi:MAG: hypothetical protein H6Q71_1648 [Firmicutes bacterium]|nr:hypothetical protein [Bacillota bacterium]
MRNVIRTVAILFFTIVIAATSPGTVLACDGEGQDGIWLGTVDMMLKYKWTFSVINLTGSTVKIGTAPDHSLGSNFPYNTTFPPGNSIAKYPDSTPPANNGDTSQIGLTTWKSGNHNKMFPDHCQATVPIEIQNNNTAYNFSLEFSQYLDLSPQSSVIVKIKPPYQTSTSTWKFSTDVADSGYVAYPPRKLSGGIHEGILTAISDRYVLCLYKTQNANIDSSNPNDLILVITERFPNANYRGNGLQWAI